MAKIGKPRDFLVTLLFLVTAFVALRPFFAYLLYRRAGDYMSALMVKDAARSYEKTLFFDAKDVDSRNWLAYCYILTGRTEEAVSEYKTAIELDPDNVMAYYDLGAIYRRAGDIQAARKMFEMAIASKKSPFTTDSNYRFYTRSAKRMLDIMSGM